MAYRRKAKRRRRSIRPSVSVAGYTRFLSLENTAPASGATALVVQDVEGVVTSEVLTENRKLIRVGGSAMMAVRLNANQHAAAMFCLRAAPQQEDWPSVSDYDPFREGPGENDFQGMPSPRPFCRRSFVLATPAGSGGETEVIQEAHMVRSKAERLLRPGWKLQAGLYVTGSQGVMVKHASLLRYVVAG